MSCSNKSDNSKAKPVEEEAKLAELLAEELFLIKQQMIEHEVEKLKVQKEIAQVKARSKVFETSAVDGRGWKNVQYGTEAPSIIGKSKHGERTWDIDQSRHGERTWGIPQSRQERNTAGMENEEIDRTAVAGQPGITSILCNLLKQQSSLDVALDVFDGNSLEYPNFVTLFGESVETETDDLEGRLIRLIRYTKRDPKYTTQHCVQHRPSVGDKNAKKILDQKYGNPYNIMRVYRKEIKSCQQIRNEDGESYQKFYNFFLK